MLLVVIALEVIHSLIFRGRTAIAGIIMLHLPVILFPALGVLHLCQAHTLYRAIPPVATVVGYIYNGELLPKPAELYMAMTWIKNLETQQIVEVLCSIAAITTSATPPPDQR